METPSVGDWLDLVDTRWPWTTAADWDVVGLQVGARDWPVRRVLVSLDVTPGVVEEAAAQPDTLVLAHHPLLFRPLERLTPDSASGRTALAAARAGVAIAAAHTNLDIAADGTGTSDPVVRALDLADVQPLTTQPPAATFKLVTFVPHDHLEAVRSAVTDTGAGTIGDYTRCTFETGGTGTFRPGDAATPHIGTRGVDEQVAERRLELQARGDVLADAIAALRASHPYEEVPLDLYRLEATEQRASIGRRGRLPRARSLRDVAALLRERLPSSHLRAAGDPDRMVSTVAVVGGAGGSMIGAAQAAGVDCFVTGDLGHHVALDAVAQGLAVIDAGHHAVEQAAMGPWTERLGQLASDRGWDTPVVASAVDTHPWIDLDPDAG